MNSGRDNIGVRGQAGSLHTCPLALKRLAQKEPSLSLSDKKEG